jgi:hypothetical protein
MSKILVLDATASPEFVIDLMGLGSMRHSNHRFVPIGRVSTTVKVDEFWVGDR